MGWILGLGNGVVFRQGGGSGSWSSYWTHLISATVENAAPTHVVLTFPTAKSLVATDFTVTVNGVARTVNSASWAGVVLTLVLASACVYGDVVVVTFVKSGGTANVTNNISAETELTTYITGLTTPLSTATLKKINDYIKADKIAMGAVANLSDAKDIDMILAGETAESSLKNLVLNDFHATAVNAPTFTAFEGFTGDGISSYLAVDYTPSVDGNTYLLDSAHFGLYFRVVDRGSNKFHGCYSTTDDGGANNRIVIGNAGAADRIAYALNGRLETDVIINSDTFFYCIIRRLVGTDHILSLNKVHESHPETSTKRPNQALTVLARRSDDTTVGLFNISQVSHITVGKGLSEAESNAQVDAFEAYMDSNGKGIIA